MENIWPVSFFFVLSSEAPPELIRGPGSIPAEEHTKGKCSLNREGSTPGLRAVKKPPLGNVPRPDGTYGRVDATRVDVREALHHTLIQTEQRDEKHNLFPGLWELLSWFISWSSWWNLFIDVHTGTS